MILFGVVSVVLCQLSVVLQVVIALSNGQRTTDNGHYSF